MLPQQKRCQGFSLLELVIFIAVASIAIGAVLLPLVVATLKSSNIATEDMVTQLAEQRMEFLISQRYLKGYSGLSDPCAAGTPPDICTLPSQLSGYTINPSGMTPPVVSSLTIGGDANYTLLHVQVQAPHDATQADLYSVVASD